MPQLVRILPFQQLSGPENMAADETMLLTAAVRGYASIRFYGWSEPTVTLGYFQASASRSSLAGLDQLPWLRRATGGGALVHHHELTYSLALPAGPSWLPGSRPWPCRMHDIIGTALKMMGVESELYSCSLPSAERPFLCFQHQTSGDLTIRGHKVAGSAQRRQHGAILQHGGILLRQSEFTPELPGICELSGREITSENLIPMIMMQLMQNTNWYLTAGQWTEEERPDHEAALEKYRSPDWNEKR